MVHHAAMQSLDMGFGIGGIMGGVMALRQAKQQGINPWTGKVGGSANAFKIAQDGGKHAGFLKNYAGKTPAQINKAINSYQKASNIHLDKITNPIKYVPNWNTLRPGHQQNLIRGWRNEVTNFGEQIRILQSILR